MRKPFRICINNKNRNKIRQKVRDSEVKFKRSNTLPIRFLERSNIKTVKEEYFLLAKEINKSSD